MTFASPQPRDVRDDLRSLVEYLRDLHVLQHPPSRTVASYGLFTADARVLQSGLPGVRFDPAGDAWLVLDLLVPPDEPVLPTALVPIAVPRLVSYERPIARADAAPDEQRRLESWVASTWDEWRQRFDEVEQSRRLYLELFAARDHIAADRSTLEFVWGFGLVRWRAHSVDHPLFTVGVEVEYVPDAARLVLRPTGTLRPETEVLTGLPLLAQRDLFNAMADVSEAGRNPWQEGFGSDVLTPLVRMLSNVSPAEGGPTLVDKEWVIFARRRPSGYLQFVSGLEAHLDELAALPTLASLVAPDPRQFESPPGSPYIGGGSAGAEPMLLPLPANDEQREILRHAASSPGVTVEGPPGTGKSHTIANLICALISQGKRVLVTAERSQALQVLLEKIPETLRPLCVPVLGGGMEERQLLVNSIDRISLSAFGVDDARGQLQALPGELDKVDRALAATRNRLRELESLEVAAVPFELGAAGSSRAAVASWLRAEEHRLGHVPDELDVGVAFPLSDDQVLELSELLDRVEPANIDPAREVPALLDLPSAAQVVAELSELAALRSSSFELAVGGVDESFDNGGAYVLEGVLADAAERLRTWEDGWLGEVLRSSAAPPRRELWSVFTDQLTNCVSAALALRGDLQAHEVLLPRPGPLVPSELTELMRVAGQLAARGRLGLGNRSVRGLLGSITVDGRLCSTADDVRLAISASELERQRQLIRNLLRAEQVIIGVEASAVERVEDIAGPIAADLSAVMHWLVVDWPAVRDRLGALSIDAEERCTVQHLEALRGRLRAVLAGRRILDLEHSHRDLLRDIRELQNMSLATPGSWADLAAAFTECDWTRWDATRARLTRLSSVRIDADRCADLLALIAGPAPLWAAALRASGNEALGPTTSARDAWDWRIAQTWFARTDVESTLGEVTVELARLERQRSRLVGELATARAWAAVVARIDGPSKVALEAYKTASSRLGKGYSKYKGIYHQQLDEALQGCRHVIPAWVMPVERVLTDFACGPQPPFDVLIIDEASQLPLTRLPVLALARQAIIVGDDKQISPMSPGRELGPTYDALEARLAGIANKGPAFGAGSSVYDVSVQRFPRKVQLREHFRCLTPIIEFSNGRYYDNRLVPLRDRNPSPGWRPLRAEHVVDGFRDEDDCNRPEAERIAALMAELVSQPEYQDRTFGVISLLGTNQSKLVYDLVFERLGPAKMARHAVRVGEASVFQGDERDVIFVSTVVADNGGRRVGSMTSVPHRQLINVTASRARDQLWVVHSLPAEAFPKEDERAALIRHCSVPPNAVASYERLLTLTDDRSPFEQAVLRHLVDRGYRTIRPQHRVGSYRIDFVIDGPHSRLALECDGERFHGPDQWETDRARQEILERAGWTFFRLRGSAFYRNPSKALEPLWARLDELGIPVGDWTSLPPRGAGAVQRLEAPVLNASACAQLAPPAVDTVDASAPEVGIAGDSNTLAIETSVVEDTQAEGGDDPWAAAFRVADQRIREARPDDRR